MPEEFCDKCTSLKEDDPQYETAKRLMIEQGCFNQNQSLTECLHNARKDWRLCKKETEQLTLCLQNSKKYK